MAGGRLVYVMGPSGVGKDSLLDWVRERLDHEPITMAHRYITRPREAVGEDHVPLSRSEFEMRRASGAFAMAWESHGNMYGIGREIDQWLQSGAMTVVVNGSRAYFPRALADYPDMVPVLITAEREVRARRLASRGREDKDGIEARLRRGDGYQVNHPALRTIPNNHDLSQAGRSLLRLLQTVHVLNGYAPAATVA